MNKIKKIIPRGIVIGLSLLSILSFVYAEESVLPENGLIRSANSESIDSLPFSLPFTREELAVVLFRLFHDPDRNSGEPDLPFTDADQISDWAKKAVHFCHEKKLMAGYAEGDFRPQATIREKELGMVMYRLLGHPISRDTWDQIDTLLQNLSLEISSQNKPLTRREALDYMRKALSTSQNGNLRRVEDLSPEKLEGKWHSVYCRFHKTGEKKLSPNILTVDFFEHQELQIKSNYFSFTGKWSSEGETGELSILGSSAFSIRQRGDFLEVTYDRDVEDRLTVYLHKDPCSLRTSEDFPDEDAPDITGKWYAVYHIVTNPEIPLSEFELRPALNINPDGTMTIFTENYTTLEGTWSSTCGYFFLNDRTEIVKSYVDEEAFLVMETDDGVVIYLHKDFNRLPNPLSEQKKP